MMSPHQSDTGLYKHSGEIWHVVQKSDGSVICNSPSYMTAANAETWKRWKLSNGWEKVD